MTIAELRAQLNHPSAKAIDDWPVLIVGESGRWQTPKGVLFDEDRVILELAPFRPEW